MKLVLKLEPLLAAQAKARQIRKPDSVVKNSAQQNQHTKTRDELAKRAGVSHDTVKKVVKITTKGAPELEVAVSEGKVSINAAAAVAEKISPTLWTICNQIQ